jgi:sialate O-acetylesterase
MMATLTDNRGVLMRFVPLIASLMIALPHVAEAAVSVPNFFSDHGVLQREAPIPVWGWADPGEVVLIQLGNSNPVKATADAKGNWKVALPAMPAGGPFELIIKGSNEIKIQDILIGEVWLCSGQSNMEWTIKKSMTPEEKGNPLTDSLIRHIKIPRRPLSQPESNVDAKWEVCSPATAHEFTACGYYMARTLRKELNVPIGLINSSWGGTAIEPWTTPDAFKHIPSLKKISDKLTATDPQQKVSEKDPAALYHGMVHPLIGYGMRGAIWYQGESNRKEGDIYTDKMQALIDGWRAVWGIGDFPFHFVQIAPHGYGKDDPHVLPRFWVAQSNALKIKNTAMVVTNDIGDAKDIHPKNKAEVGRRLALIALAKNYGKTDVVYQGPTFSEAKTEGDTMLVSFTNAEGLKTRDGKTPDWFEIKNDSSEWTKATAVIKDNAIIVSAPEVKAPNAVRFCWDKNAGPNLQNGAGLPAAAFTTKE